MLPRLVALWLSNSLCSFYGTSRQAEHLLTCDEEVQLVEKFAACLALQSELLKFAA